MTNKNYEFLKTIHKKGFSQVELSNSCRSISEPMLSRIINGHKQPTDDQLEELAVILKISACTIRKYFSSTTGAKNA